MESQHQTSKSQRRSSQREILELMRQTEALEWLDRYQEQIYQHGKNHARAWWDKTITDIKRIRGEKAANQLRETMNRLKNEIRKKR